MNIADIEKELKLSAEKTEAYLAACYDDAGLAPSLISEAQKYSLLSGGKRIRAFLVFELCRMFGGEESAAAPFACAVEMVHAYSLIHDDLPCMDDDDYRRGKLTNHKVYGEAIAVLAGDALLTKAFEIASSNKSVLASVSLEAVKELALAAGDAGMIGGQVLDIKAESELEHSIELLEKIHRLKTGAMISVSARLGCLAAGIEKSDEAYADVELFAQKIGLVFQIVDDILDVVGDSKILGKTVGSDQENGKLTFMSFYSVEEARRLARKITDEAITVISKYDNSSKLASLAEYLLNRSF